MVITAIRRQKRRSSRVNIYLDGEYNVSLAAEIVVREGLRAGEAVDKRQLAALVDQDLELRAYESALSLIAHRARTRAEIAKRLVLKGFPQSVVDICLERLLSAGLLDDEGFARDFVRERLRTRPKGFTGLKADLISRGIERDSADRVVHEVLDRDGHAELDLAKQAARKFRRKPGEDARKTVRRLHAFLARRGFSAGVVSDLISEGEDEWEAGSDVAE